LKKISVNYGVLHLPAVYQVGAMTGPDLLALLSSSEISPKDYVWRTDWVEWKLVITVFPEFFTNS
jgi:hypothetical protein